MTDIPVEIIFLIAEKMDNDTLYKFIRVNSFLYKTFGNIHRKRRLLEKDFLNRKYLDLNEDDLDFIVNNFNKKDLTELFLQGCKNNNMLIVRFLISKVSKISQEDGYLCAIKNGYVNIAEILRLSYIEVSINIRIAALNIAVSSGKINSLIYLFKYYGYESPCINFALNIACEHGHFKAVKFLFSKIKRKKIITFHTHFNSALKSCNIKIIKFLLQNTNSITLISSEDVLYLVNKGYLNIVKFLFDHGIQSTSYADYAIYLSIKHRNISELWNVIDNYGHFNYVRDLALLFAIDASELNMIKFLIHDSVDIIYETKILFKAAKNNIQMMNYLETLLNQKQKKATNKSIYILIILSILLILFILILITLFYLFFE